MVIRMFSLCSRYSNDHDMFQEILTLLTDNFASTNEKAYISFATDAINAIYHVSDRLSFDGQTLKTSFFYCISR